ncbi:MAG: hypothetical protein OJF47_000606 [Nitrospira sp.]|jgi:hypothetical protein|nr:MAG: hypothetical protein OJF47_000606 [Nitrospira sp.]
MRGTIHPTSIIERPVETGAHLTMPGLPYGIVAWLFMAHADRWGRRALFYERHRDYFPRLSSGRFVARCRALESTYRRLSQALWNMASRVRWVSIRPIVSRIE